MPPEVLPLVPTQWLAAQLDNPAFLAIDLRIAIDGGRAGYEAGHVPGAVYSDYAGDGWRAKVDNVPGLLPDGAHLSALFARLGIVPRRHVGLIPAGSSASDFAASARAYWTLKHSGHDAVSILDGGTRGWAGEGRALEVGWRESTAAPPYPVRGQSGLRSEAAAVMVALNAKSHTLVDARAPSYFEGREKAGEAKRAGHIPGAHSYDYAQFFDAGTGRLKPVETLRAMLAGILAGPVISYCNTGHTAALDWFVLSEVLGRPGVSLYDGSMTDWTQEESRPVAGP